MIKHRAYHTLGILRWHASTFFCSTSLHFGINRKLWYHMISSWHAINMCLYVEHEELRASKRDENNRNEIDPGLFWWLPFEWVLLMAIREQKWSISHWLCCSVHMLLCLGRFSITALYPFISWYGPNSLEKNILPSCFCERMIWRRRHRPWSCKVVTSCILITGSPNWRSFRLPPASPH